MLDFVFDRRSFLRIGSIGASMTAAGFTEQVFSAQDGFDAYEDKTVVWLWHGGGPTQFETLGKIILAEPAFECCEFF